LSLHLYLKKRGKFGQAEINKILLNKKRRDAKVSLFFCIFEFMKRVAVFAGSFDPFTIGHRDIYDQAESVFGEGNILLALGKNPEKSSVDFARELEIKNNNPSMNVASYNGFLHHFVNKLEEEGFDVTLVRGLRNGADLQYEQNQIAFIRDFKPDIKVMFLLCKNTLGHISSSAVRAIQKNDPFGAEKYISKEV